jgi:hypothetical protein
MIKRIIANICIKQKLVQPSLTVERERESVCERVRDKERETVRGHENEK